MITVIIPVLNEEKTIGKVIHFVKKTQSVNEVIVVDDKSTDNTVQEAKNAGASVITSTKIGKGASMRDGLLVAKNEIIVFLDGDGDFQPLLSLLFPQLDSFLQPLSGMIAGKKEFFKKIIFEDDYGVDIGILIDMNLIGARIAEVNIGVIQHKMKQWQELTHMSREVARAILKRAVNSSLVNLNSLETINIIRDQMGFAIKETLSTLKKMIIFDMDNTILNGRFIDKAAITFGFQKELVDIVIKNQDSYLLTKLIARFFKGFNISQLLAVADEVPIVSDIFDVVKELKKRGYIIGIISDSYDCIAIHIKNKIGADFALANELEFSQSIATGEIKIPSFFMKTDRSRCNHNFCKSNALLQVSEQYGIELSNIIAVGDSEFDICMVRLAGIGVAFCSSSNILNTIADQKIESKSFRPILNFAI